MGQGGPDVPQRHDSGFDVRERLYLAGQRCKPSVACGHRWPMRFGGCWRRCGAGLVQTRAHRHELHRLVRQRWRELEPGGRGTSVPLAASVRAGLAVTAHNNSLLCLAGFDNVLVLPTPLPPPALPALRRAAPSCCSPGRDGQAAMAFIRPAISFAHSVAAHD